MLTVFSRLNTTDVCLKIGSFDPAFSRPGRLIRVQRLLIKCNSPSLFQVDLIITDPKRPRSSLWGGIILPFVLPQELQVWQLYVHYPKSQYYVNVHFDVQYPSQLRYSSIFPFKNIILLKYQNNILYFVFHSSAVHKIIFTSNWCLQSWQGSDWTPQVSLFKNQQFWHSILLRPGFNWWPAFNRENTVCHYLAPLPIHKNVPLEIWGKYQTNFIRKPNHYNFFLLQIVQQTVGNEEYFFLWYIFFVFLFLQARHQNLKKLAQNFFKV